ncbi:tetratricopeptide repeat protein [Microcoleus sp. F4-D5]|uniref:tetratricopeptide repeat protein n=1 Tax=Microcoleus sp. F4-D5 TaxID=2818760 RepID=UPI002FD1F603
MDSNFVNAGFVQPLSWMLGILAGTSLSLSLLAQSGAAQLHPTSLQELQRQQEIQRLGDPPKKKDRQQWERWQRRYQRLLERHERERRWENDRNSFPPMLSPLPNMNLGDNFPPLLNPLPNMNLGDDFPPLLNPLPNMNFGDDFPPMLSPLPNVNFGGIFQPSFFVTQCRQMAGYFKSRDRKHYHSENKRCDRMEEEERRAFNARQQQLQQQLQQQQLQEQERLRLIQEGNSFQSKGKHEEAEPIFRQLAEQYPRDAYLRYKWGNTLYNLGKIEEAAQAYHQAIKINSKYAIAHHALGVLRMKQGQLEAALAEFKQAISINPKYADALYSLGQALWNQGKMTEALEFLRKAKDLFSEQRRLLEVKEVDNFLQQIGQ